MVNRPDGDPRHPAFADDDDWFSAPDEESVEASEIVWQDDPGPPPSPPRAPRSDLARRQIAIVIAVAAVIALIAVPILLVRAFSGSGDTATPVTTAAVVTTPVDTTPVETTPAATTPATTTPAASSVPTGTVLRPGASGDAVKQLQLALTQLGYQPGTADGDYGPTTTQAVTAFQQSNGLSADGIAGPETITAINAALSSG